MSTDLRPILGLILPPANRGVPEEGIAVYGAKLRFVVAGLGIELMGTSLTFYRGESFNRQLRDTVTQACGLRATTMSDGVIDALLVSCGGFRTLEIIAPLEAEAGVPVISSMPHGLWAGARLLGLTGAAPGFGKLLSA